MIIGTNQVDGIILVISAVDGPMPQTREHLLLTKSIGIENIVVFLNKMDQFDLEFLDPLELEEDIEYFLDSCGYDSSKIPIIKGSALKALENNDKDIVAIKELINIIDKMPNPVRPIDQPFLMSIEDVFSIKDKGTVVTGRIERGTIKEGDEVEIVGLKKTQKTSVLQIQSFRKIISQGNPGNNVGILLKDINKNDVIRGQIISKPKSIKPSHNFECQCYFLSKYEGGRHTPFFNGYRPQFYFRNADITGKINLPESIERAMPGDNILNMNVELDQSIAMEKGLRFAIREGGITVGTGVVTKLLSSDIPKQRESVVKKKSTDVKKKPTDVKNPDDVKKFSSEKSNNINKKKKQ